MRFTFTVVLSALLATALAAPTPQMCGVTERTQETPTAANATKPHLKTSNPLFSYLILLPSSTSHSSIMRFAFATVIFTVLSAALTTTATPVDLKRQTCKRDSIDPRDCCEC
ncbi:hypothetical protein AURDEDRAFT_160308 [Auricularia subglabra TFB-10046 SS5]|nr:hypothetical protein AURDEDRAFT_160308 [Auricularia subglabra TFB-10046 SS5]